MRRLLSSMSKLWPKRTSGAASSTLEDRLRQVKMILDVCDNAESRALIRIQRAGVAKHAEVLCNAIRYVIITARDLDILLNSFPKDNLPEVHHLHLRVQALILYELFVKLDGVLGKELNAVLRTYKLDAVKTEIHKQHKRITDMKDKHQDFISQVRHSVIGHRDVKDQQFAMVLASPKLIVVDLVTRVVLGHLLDLTTALLDGCEEIMRSHGETWDVSKPP